MGSENSISQKFKNLKLNISGDRARRTVKPSDYNIDSYSPNYTTAISDKIACWEGEQFLLSLVFKSALVDVGLSIWAAV